MNGAFSAGPDPGSALLTDGQQMAFCVQREQGSEREGTERKGERKEEKRHSEGRGGVLRFFSGLFSLGPYMQV